MQIKTTTRYYFTPVRTAITENKNKKTENKYQKGSEEIGTMYNVGGDIRIREKTEQRFVKKFKNNNDSVQSLSCVRLFETPWTAERQGSLSTTNSQSLLKLMSIESVMPSNHLILCHPLLVPSIFPASGSFQMSRFFTSGGQSIGVSASATVFPKNIQD